MNNLNPYSRNRLKQLTSRMLKMKFIIGLSGLLTFSANQIHAQVTVSATAGTASSNYTTVNEAFTAINAGTHQGAITITVTANTTEPATPVPLLRSNAPSSYTSILIQPSGNVSINSAASPTANRGILEFAGADNVTIDGDDPLTAGSRNLSIVAATSSTSGIACIRLSSNSTSGADGADNNTVKNCIITGSRINATSTTTNYGIQFANGTGASSSSTGAYSSLNTLIQNNQITRCYYGIYAYGNSTSYYNTGTVIKGNTIGSSTPANIVGYYGIFLNYSSAGTSGTAIIEENDIQVGDITTGYSVNVAGIYLTTGTSGTVLRKNKIHDVANPSSSGYGAYGIQIAAAVSAIEISNNFISDITTTNYSTSLTTAYQNYGIYVSAAATGIKILHNTIVFNKPNATNYGTSNPSSALINITSSTATVAQMLNNILVNNQGTASSNAYCIITSATGNISGGTINNNNYYVNGNGKVGYYSAAARNTLPLWQTATSKDALSKNELPPFTSGTDFHIATGAYTTLESAGASTATTGITADIDGQTRPGASTYGFGTAPDIGADEFDGRQGLCGPVAVTATNATPANNLCTGNIVSFSLTPVPYGAGYTYQWQSSNDNVTYTNVANATAITYSGAVTAKYYRCLIKCASTSDSAFSSPVTLNYNSDVLTTTPGTRCGAGTVALQATGTSGSMLRWYSNATGGLPLGTGTSFTTPTITTTTNYFVEATGSGAGTVRIGSGTASMGTTSYPNPLSAYYGGTKHQLLFLASELAAQGLLAGNITAISFDVTAFNANGICNDLTIRMGTTTNTALTGFVTGTAPVYNASYTPSATGVVTFTFTTPFNWNGTDNIVLETVHNAGNSGNGSGTTVAYTPTTFNSVYLRYADNITPAGAGSFDATTDGTTATSMNRPNVVFSGVSGCSSPRKQVTATVTQAAAFDITNNQTVCNNSVTTLTVNTPVANYDNVTWSPATDLYTNAAATIPYTAGTNVQTVYHKSTTSSVQTYTATAYNATTTCGAIDSIKLTVLPATLTVLGPSESICLSGTGTLNITNSPILGTATIQWQESNDNINFTDINGANANTYTTPTLTATKYYRVRVLANSTVCQTNSISDTVKVLTPAVVSVTHDTLCGPGVLDLSATANAGNTIKWYATPTSTTVLSSGNNYQTPNLNTSTTYYVAASASSTTRYNVGLVNYIQNNPFITSSGGWGLNFTVTNPCSIDSVGVYPIGTGTLTAVIWNAATQAVVHTAPVSQTLTGTGTTKTMIYIGANNLPPGNYKMGIQSFSGLTNLRNEGFSASAYPFTSPALNITGGSQGWSSSTPNVYYFFYDWKIRVGSSCESSRTPVTATILQKPVANLNPSGTINICAGDSTTLTASGGSTYSWLRNGVTIPGQTNTTLTVSQTDPYRAVVQAVNGCTDTSLSANVVVQPDPVVFLGNDTTYCGNVPYTLNAGNAGATFLWNDNSTAGTLNVVNAGQYSVTVTNIYNCSSSDTINITHNPYPIVDLGVDTMICSVTPLILNASNAGASYLWNTNENTQTISVSQAGDYSVAVTNGYNCIGKDTITITVRPLTDNFGFDFEPLFNIQPGRVKFTPINHNPAYTYFWDFGDGTTSDITMPTHDYASSGNYTVSLRSSDGCTDSLEQLEIYVDLYTNVVRINKSDIAVKVYPNPSNNVLNIQLERNDASIKSLAVFNVLGQQVLHVSPRSKQSRQEQLSLDNLAAGGYIIKINTDKGTISRKFDIIR